MIVGVEVRDDAVVAVLTDGNAAVAARDKREGTDSSLALEAVRALIPHGPVSAIGIAVRDPHEDASKTTAAALATAAGLSNPGRLLTRGTAVALGEAWAGVAQGVSHVAALVAADAVHAGLVIDGAPFEGAHGFAGAASWLALNPVERDDYRKAGCLQAEINAAAIVRRVIWRIRSGDHSRVLELAGGDLRAITVHQIFDAARGGDDVSISVVRDTARYVGMAVANLVAITDPNIVVLGGLIAEAADQLLQPALTEALRRLPRSIATSLTLIAASLGEDGGPIGAARAAMLAQ